MISVLIVDDDERKRNRIAEVLHNALGDHCKWQIAVSASGAASLLEENDFNLLILDINLPVRDQEEPKRDGGMRLLRNLVRGGPRLRRPQHIVGLTAYEDLIESFENDFESESWQLLKYEATSNEWQDVLSNRAVYIAGAVDQGRKQEQYITDLAIVTALKAIELDAVLDLPAQWETQQVDGDDSFYHVGCFERDSRRISVVCAASIEMGMTAAACLSHKIVQNFRPRYLAIAGIAAGVDANFGDIIVADQSWDYGSGKVYSDGEHESEFRPAPNYIAIDAELKEKAQFFAQERKDSVSGIRESWKGNKPETALQVRVGPMASGAAVVESAEAIEAIKRHNRKVIAVEMEAYGVYLACRTVTTPRPKCFAAKAVCDFGTPPKTDDHQRYAAYTSASFVYEFALDQL